MLLDQSEIVHLLDITKVHAGEDDCVFRFFNPANALFHIFVSSPSEVVFDDDEKTFCLKNQHHLTTFLNQLQPLKETLAQAESLPVYGQPDSRKIEVVFISTHNDQDLFDQASKSQRPFALPLDLFAHLQRQGYQSLHVITDNAVLQLKNKLVFVGTRQQLDAQVEVLKKKYRGLDVKTRAFQFKTITDWGYFNFKYTVAGDTTTITNDGDASKVLEYAKSFFV